VNRDTSQAIRVIIWALMVCAAPSVVMADYAIASYTIEASGTTSSGGGFLLTNTIQPPGPNVPVMTGGAFALEGGLQLGLADASDEVGTASHCGRGVEEALPLLMIALVGLYVVTKRRA